MRHNENHVPACECEEIHSDIVEKRRAEMPDDSTLYDLSDFFKVLGDSTRISILFAIDGEPMCVCDIANLLGMTKSAVSHQLRVLKNAKLVRGVKEGKEVKYSLDDNHVMMIISCGLTHLAERD